MLAKPQPHTGFTIVELLIVIVIIGILAMITIVAYNGIQQRAHTATVQSDLASASGQLSVNRVLTSGYATDLATANLKASSGTVFTYNYNSDNDTYCLSATNAGTTYSVASNNTIPQSGDCSTNGLVGWWPIKSNANDATGNGNDGVVTSATLTTGQNGIGNGAYLFNGSTSYISTPLPATRVTDMTLSGWGFIQPGTTKGTIAHVGTHDGYSIGVGTALSAVDSRATGLFPGTRWINTSFSIGAGWHLITLVLSASGVPSIYSDGVIVGTYLGTNATVPTTQASIGRNMGDDGATQAERTFNSSIDDVRLYSRALSGSEIQALYTAGAV